MRRSEATGGRCDVACGPVGNRTRRDDGGTVTEYEYNRANQLAREVTGAASIDYTYDGAGNLIEKDPSGGTPTYYTWDVQNRLIEFNDSANNAEFAYDSDDRRVRKTESSQTTSYLYDFNKLLQEREGANTADYTYSLEDEYGDLISQYRDDGASGESTYYDYDAVGSVDALRDQSAGEKNTYKYSAFGKIKDETGATDNAFTFIGSKGYFDNQPIGRYRNRSQVGQ